MTTALVQSLPLVRSESGPGAFLRREVIGDATLYLGDCREVLPLIGKVDAVVTDPPYGIGESNKKNLSRKNKAAANDYGDFDWDQKPASDDLIQMARSMSENQAVFGGNYFNLPPTPCWLVWDKMNTGDFADCELAWTNWKKAVRKIQWRWNGMIRQGNEERFHPTQKPLGVMIWAIKLCPEPNETILDPFMGSGTTGVAALQLGRKFIGIEREPKYFDIACERIRKESEQVKILDVFDAKPEKFETPSLL